MQNGGPGGARRLTRHALISGLGAATGRLPPPTIRSSNACTQVDTVRNGRDALQGTCHGAVGPMVETAQALALTESDVANVVNMVLDSRWDALARDFWWRGVMVSRDRFSGAKRLMCQG